MSATPRPWALTQLDGADSSITLDRGSIVLPTEDAALLVRAVNSYEAMREALRDCVQPVEALIVLECDCSMDGGIHSCGVGKVRNILEKAQAALALAGKE